MVTISKYSNNSFLKNIFQGLLISICGSIGSFLVLAPISLFIKIGVLLFILMVFVFFANPFLAINSFLFIRPSIQPLMDVEIVPGVPIVGIFSLWIITYLIFRFLNDKSYTVAIPNIKILFIMIILSLFSMFNSKSLTTSIAHLLRLMGWISIYILIFNLVSTWDDAKKIIFVLILSSVIPLLVGYYQLFTNTGAIDELRGGINRIYSVFKGNANTAGVFFSMNIFIMLIVLVQTKDLLIKRLIQLLVLATLIIIIFTYHRTSQYTLAAGILVMCIFNKKMIKLAVPIFLLAIIIFHGEIARRIVEIFHPPQYAGNSLTSRFSYWEIVIFKLFPQHPFIGLGIGGVADALKKYLFYAEPHNDYIRVSVEIGIFGGLLYVMFFLMEVRYYFYHITRNINRELNITVLGLLVFFIIMQSAQNVIYNVTILTPLVSMLAVSKKLNLIHPNCL
ncbi:MAG: O-antigen ligase family protein [Planctomycetia bacterium]|nr:O-antigen ligase family protein [Candidatus Brocadia sp.]QOJ06518.1 MAG: O-antigen ligase family protein [Planctomycetia bacterium]TVL95657.1 MAG: hypothetical protein CV082_10245 [Candidatus Brocadia sp. BL1]HQU30679.1 O-antigen ligase family protein [Candidatus Brocadia sapporoensis]